MVKHTGVISAVKRRGVKPRPTSAEQRINLLTAQIRILKKQQWPGVEGEIEQRRAELRAALIAL